MTEALCSEAASRRPNIVRLEVYRPSDDEIIQYAESTNLRTDAGADWQAQQMSGADADRRAIFIGLTADTSQTINAAQTELTGEETANGLARASGTFAHAGGGATTYTVQHQFTYTGGSAITLTRSALFAAAGPPPAPPMVFFAAFGADATLVDEDQITVTWTVSI